MSTDDGLAHKPFKNWVRSVLALNYLKNGIVAFVDNRMCKEHTSFISEIKTVCSIGEFSCSKCTVQTLLPRHVAVVSNCPYQPLPNGITNGPLNKCRCQRKGRRPCPENNGCGNMYDLIVQHHHRHRPMWDNTDFTKWANEYWEVAKSYLSCTGYADKTCASETDIAGLLSICTNNLPIRRLLHSDGIAFEQARKTRNEILHSSNFEIDDTELMSVFSDMMIVLQDPVFKGHTVATDAMNDLQKLQANQIHISSDAIYEARELAWQAIVQKQDDTISRIEQMKNICLHELQEKANAIGMSKLEEELTQLKEIEKRHFNDMVKQLNVIDKTSRQRWETLQQYVDTTEKRTRDFVVQVEKGVESRTKDYTDKKVIEVRKDFSETVDKLKELLTMRLVPQQLQQQQQIQELHKSLNNIITPGKMVMTAEKGTITEEQELTMFTTLVNVSTSILVNGPSTDDVLQNKMSNAFEDLSKDSINVTKATQECIAFHVECETLEALVALFEGCMTGQIASLFKPVEDELRRWPGYEHLKLQISMYEEDFWSSIASVSQQLNESYRTSTGTDILENVDQVSNKAINTGTSEVSNFHTVTGSTTTSDQLKHEKTKVHTETRQTINSNTTGSSSYTLSVNTEEHTKPHTNQNKTASDYGQAVSACVDDDIAIVGVGCRFPGADNLDEFWRVLINGENHVQEIHNDRWNNDAFFDENKDASGKFYTKHAGLLKNHDAWDNRFFGVSDAEAARVDPQQRYVLECTHMAMEDAGITKSQINGTKTGVYVGAMNDDYRQLISSDPNANITSYSSTGMSTTLISNRVSYTYNLHGPSMTLDTGCSSSLVAIHLGSQAILSGECDQAICGGVNSILNPDTNKSLCKSRFLSEVGQCQAFCDTADGYVRAEGCGIVVLMRLKDAEVSNRNIWGVIKTSCNQDGRAVVPITAPSRHQQETLLKQVYSKHQINPVDVQYIEAHGTGTQIGDATEANALGRFFSHYHTEDKEARRKLLIGSVKTNIGHTESAAGIAGLIKVLLMMKNGKIVPSLHVKKNKSNVIKDISLTEYSLDIPVDVQEWDVNLNGDRMACINSYGFGGSNSHAVVWQHSKGVPSARSNCLPIAMFPIAISAPDNTSLKRNLCAFGEDLKVTRIAIDDISYTSMYHREQLKSRTLLQGRDKQAIQQQINVRLKNIEGIQYEESRNLIFVFCGIGTTWTGMCKEMMNLDVFRRKVDEIDSYLQPLTSWTIGELFLQETHYDDPFVNHIAIFSSQVALAAVWLEWKIFPDAIVGQSVGEVAAAHVAGIISLKEAVQIIYTRSKILATQRQGSMMVVGNMSVSEIENLCAKYRDVSIAVFLSPVACTISGDATELSQLNDEIQQQSEKVGKRYLVRKLDARCAYHSKYVEQCVSDLVEQIGEMDGVANPKYKIISTVSGIDADVHDYLTGLYWARNARQPVLLHQALLNSIVQNGKNVFLEIGPMPVLPMHLPHILQDIKGKCLASMNENMELDCLYESSKELYQIGWDIDMLPKDERPKQPVFLPRYYFNRRKSLYISEKIRSYISGINITEGDSHLYVRKVTSAKGFSFQLSFSRGITPFIYEHLYTGIPLVPGATYVDVGFHIGSVCLNRQITDLCLSVEFILPLTPKDNEDVLVSTRASKRSDGSVRFQCRYKGIVYTSGMVSVRADQQRMSENITEICTRCNVRRNQQESYDCLADLGFQYNGPCLRLIEQSWSNDQECVVKLSVPTTVSTQFTRTKIHPAVVDAAFQTVGILETNRIGPAKRIIIPVSVDRAVMNGLLCEKMYTYAYIKHAGDDSMHYHVSLLSEDGNVIADLNNLVIKSSSPRVKDDTLAYDMAYSHIDIQRVPTVLKEGSILVSGDTSKSNWFSEFVDARPVFKNTQFVDTLVSLKDEAVAVVFYTPKCYLSTAKNATKDVLESTVERFKKLKDLVLHLSTNGFTCPLFVLTENTQKNPEKQGMKEVNLCGSELWGMVRAIRHEHIYPDIRLIDMDSNDIDKPSLEGILYSRDKVLQNAELNVAGPEAYRSRMVVSEDTEHGLRDVHMDRSQNACLFSNNPAQIVKPYFISHEKDKNNPPELSGLLKIQLKSVVRHNQSLFHVSDFVGNTSGRRSFQNDGGFKVVAIEGRGILLSHRCLGKEVIFCCPLYVETPYVHVPEGCVIPCESIPFYKDGLLVLTCILYKLTERVPTNSDVLLVGNDTTMVATTKAFLKQRRCRTETVHVNHLKETYRESIKNKVTVVIIANMDSDSWEELFLWVTPDNLIVTLSNSDLTMRQSLIHFKYPRIKVEVIDAASVIQKECLASVIPEVHTLLHTLGFQNLLKEDTVSFWDYPMGSLLLEDHSIDSLPLRVGTDGLFQMNACYIIVGGLKGLGWLLLQYMAKSGAGHLAIFSRTLPSEDKKNAIQKIEDSFTCNVHHFKVDVCDVESLETGIKQLEDILGNTPIRGIFNGAGVLSDELLITQTDEQIREAIAPKVVGSWNLHICSKRLPLDYFVMHSSIAAIVGNVCQSNYAAGNSFMDTLVLYRRTLGLPGQSINWGALSVGMGSADPIITKYFQSQGIDQLSEDEIIGSFTEALLQNDSQPCFARINWDRMGQHNISRGQTKLFRELSNRKRSMKESKESSISEDSTCHNTRKETIEEFVRNSVSTMFLVDKANRPLNASRGYVHMKIEGT